MTMTCVLDESVLSLLNFDQQPVCSTLLGKCSNHRRAQAHWKRLLQGHYVMSHAPGVKSLQVLAMTFTYAEHSRTYHNSSQLSSMVEEEQKKKKSPFA